MFSCLACNSHYLADCFQTWQVKTPWPNPMSWTKIIMCGCGGYGWLCQLLHSCLIFQKKLGQCLPLFRTLNTLNEDFVRVSVSGSIVSFLVQTSVQQFRVFVVTFCISKCAKLFSVGDRSGLQASQSSTNTLFLHSHAFVMRVAYHMALSSLNMHGLCWKSYCFEGGLLLQNLCTFQHWGCLYRSSS